jgi:hypothetical protein
MMVDDIGQVIDAEFDWLIRPSAAVAGDVPNLFFLLLPDSPDFAVALYQYPASPPAGLTMTNQKGIERPRLQVLVRSPKVNEAYDRSYDIYNFILSGAFKGVTLNGEFYQTIEGASSPGDVGPDDKARHRVTTNYTVWKGQ